MAKPIKETPVLRGKDAKRFLENIRNPKQATDKELEDIRKAKDFFDSIGAKDVFGI